MFNYRTLKPILLQNFQGSGINPALRAKLIFLVKGNTEYNIGKTNIDTDIYASYNKAGVRPFDYRNGSLRTFVNWSNNTDIYRNDIAELVYALLLKKMEIMYNNKLDFDMSKPENQNLKKALETVLKRVLSATDKFFVI